MVQAEIKDTFKVGIYTTKLELDKKNLTNFCNITEQKNKSIFVSNTGYQSNIFYSKDSVVINLQKEILEHSKEYAKYLGYDFDNLNIKNMWININYYKDFNLPHNHGTDIISGVFYVEVPKDSGEIVFENPCNKMDIVNGVIKDFTPYNSTRWSFMPCNLSLFLFPSWLTHHVMPNLNKKSKRISIAFNVNTK